MMIANETIDLKCCMFLNTLLIIIIIIIIIIIKIIILRFVKRRMQSYRGAELMAFTVVGCVFPPTLQFLVGI